MLVHHFIMMLSICVCVCACVCMCLSSAYKEKVKELPLVSLFCACLNPQTLEKPTYKAEGEKYANMCK